MGEYYVDGLLEQKIESLLRDYGFPHHSASVKDDRIVVEDWDSHDPSVGIYGGEVFSIYIDKEKPIAVYFNNECREAYDIFLTENIQDIVNEIENWQMMDYRKMV